MKKFNLNFLKGFIFILIILSSLYSCKKNDITQQPVDSKTEFFNLPASIHPQIKKVADELRKADDKFHFVDNLVKKDGLPVWSNVISNINLTTGNKSINQKTGTSSDTSIFFIPISNITTEITSYIVCLNVDTNYNFTLYRKNVLDTILTNAENKKRFLESALSLFQIFEKQINKKDSLYIGGIYDKYIYNASISFVNDSYRSQTYYYSITTCYDSPCPQARNSFKTSIAPTHCSQCTTTWYDEWGNQVSDPGIQGGGGGSGGGGEATQSPEIYEDANTSDDGDYDNNSTDGYDNTTYNYYYYTDPWPIIANVIPKSDFVGISSLHENCMDLAKAQIAKKGYQISNYGEPGQTFQVYTESGGINKPVAEDAVSYLLNALKNGLPVIAGVDVHSGSSNPQTDNTTDHFIVIVGKGSDNAGNYFRFYDNSTSWVTNGASDNNKLYYNSSTGLIQGRTQSPYGNYSGFHDYIVTQVRKSKLK